MTIGGVDSDLIQDRATALDFHHSGRFLAIGSGVPSRSGQVLVVSSDQGSVLRNLDQIHSDSVLSVRFSPDGNRLASGLGRQVDPCG